jgi:hypothetical protein
MTTYALSVTGLFFGLCLYILVPALACQKLSRVEILQYLGLFAVLAFGGAVFFK